jgi:hypothetical protein
MLLAIGTEKANVYFILYTGCGKRKEGGKVRAGILTLDAALS